MYPPMANRCSRRARSSRLVQAWALRVDLPFVHPADAHVSVGNTRSYSRKSRDESPWNTPPRAGDGDADADHRPRHPRRERPILSKLAQRQIDHLHRPGPTVTRLLWITYSDCLAVISCARALTQTSRRPGPE